MKKTAFAVSAILVCLLPFFWGRAEEQERIVFSNAYARLYKGWDPIQREYFVSGYMLGMDFARKTGNLPRKPLIHKAVMPLMDFCYQEGNCMHLAPGVIIDTSNLDKEEACAALIAEEEVLTQAFKDQERRRDAKRLEELHKEQQWHEEQKQSAQSK